MLGVLRVLLGHVWRTFEHDFYWESCFSSKHKLERSKSCCLVNAGPISHHDLDKVSVPLVLFITCSDAQHGQQCMIQPFYGSIGLGMVRGCFWIPRSWHISLTSPASKLRPWSEWRLSGAPKRLIHLSTNVFAIVPASWFGRLSLRPSSEVVRDYRFCCGQGPQDVSGDPLHGVSNSIGIHLASGSPGRGLLRSTGSTLPNPGSWTVSCAFLGDPQNGRYAVPQESSEPGCEGQSAVAECRYLSRSR